MIKLFDFKFLILLTLAIVIYFMYKDIDEQRDRIQKLEETYNSLLEDTCIPEKKENKNLDKEKKENKEVKNLKLELPNKMLEKKENPLNNYADLNPEEEDQDSDSDYDSDADEESSSYKSPNNNVKHLEIYSNDNDNLETSISKSLVENKNDLTKESIKEEAEESGEGYEEESEEGSEEESEEGSEEGSEVHEIINEFESSSPTPPKSKSPKSISPKSISPKASENLEDILNDLKIEISNETLPKYDLTSLSKMKVNEIQELAKNENILIDKKVNGSNKKKTKQELMNELINLQNKDL